MPTPRRFGQDVDQNVRRGPNISPAERQRIIAEREVGVTVRELAAEFGRSESAIKYTLRTYTKTATTEERPRSGRPRILSHHQEKIIYRKVRAAPKLEYSDLAKHAVYVNVEGTPLKPPSRSTLYRVLKPRGLTNNRCKKRPKLTLDHAYKRRGFCRRWVNFPWRRRTVKFSDECSVQKGSGANNEWAFRFSWEKWKKEMLTECSTGGKPAQIVWGSIWLDERGHARRSKLVIMERDPDAPRGGYSAESYIKVLTKGLLTDAVIKAAATSGQESLLCLFDEWAGTKVVAQHWILIARLCGAASDGDAEAVVHLAKQGVPVDSKDIWGVTPL